MYSHKRVTRELQTLYICKLYMSHVWVVTTSASASLLRRPHEQNVVLDFGYVLDYFQRKLCESLVKSCFWKFQTINNNNNNNNNNNKDLFGSSIFIKAPRAIKKNYKNEKKC